ncbi:hypothetical protein [Lichenicola sp.]
MRLLSVIAGVVCLLATATLAQAEPYHHHHYVRHHHHYIPHHDDVPRH